MGLTEGFFHRYNANTTTSARTKAASNAIKHNIAQSTTNGSKRAKRDRKKKVRLSRTLVEVNPCEEHKLGKDQCLGRIYTRVRWGKGKAEYVIDNHGKALKVIDSNEAFACHLKKEEGVFAFVKADRKYVLNSIGGSTQKTIGALNVLQTTENSTKRSCKKTGVSTSGHKYTTFGVKVPQGRRGFTSDKLSAAGANGRYERARQILKRFSRRVNEIASYYVDPELLRAIGFAHDRGFIPSPSGFGDLSAALASSCNYHAPAHTDPDFMFSIHQILCDGVETTLDCQVVQFFCFPSLGLAVALRPGDVLLFNPHIFHCLSAKMKAYRHVNCHVTTFYLKTAHVGQNDNSLALTAEQEHFLSLDD